MASCRSTTTTAARHIAWADRHRTLLFLLALAAVLVATVTIAATVATRRPAVAPAPEPAAPPTSVEDHCDSPPRMLLAAVPVC